jgi:DnaJ-class molecular chaperone
MPQRHFRVVDVTHNERFLKWVKDTPMLRDCPDCDGGGAKVQQFYLGSLLVYGIEPCPNCQGTGQVEYACAN